MARLFQDMRRWAIAATVALASCGGGGDASNGTIVLGNTDTVTTGMVTSPTSGPSSSLTLLPIGVSPGTYTVPSAGAVSGMLLVHPDGHMLATAHFEPTNPAELDGWATTLFAGTVASSDLGAAGTVTFVFVTPKALTQSGSATAALTQASLNGVPALTASLANTPVGIPFVSQTYSQVSVSPALHLLPMAKLAGRYVDATNGQDLQIAPDGAVGGAYAANCAITTALAGYDPDTTLFRMTATLAGTGCAAGIQGTHEYLGNLGISSAGHLMLDAYAISGSDLATLVFTHSQQLGTY